MVRRCKTPGRSRLPRRDKAAFRSLVESGSPCRRPREIGGGFPEDLVFLLQPGVFPPQAPELFLFLGGHSMSNSTPPTPRLLRRRGWEMRGQDTERGTEIHHAGGAVA